MDARELRIGNFLSGVIEDDQGEEKRLAVVVRGVDADSTLIDGTCKYSLTSLYGKDYEYYHDIEPIPLTEEWLERFGFDKKKIYKISETKDVLNSDKTLEFEFYGNELHLWIASESFDNALYIPLRNIKHVHHLQNLYHALTGQELKLKEQ
jgi:hypothetical protein